MTNLTYKIEPFTVGGFISSHRKTVSDIETDAELTVRGTLEPTLNDAITVLGNLLADDGMSTELGEGWANAIADLQVKLRSELINLL